MAESNHSPKRARRSGRWAVRLARIGVLALSVTAAFYGYESYLRIAYPAETKIDEVLRRREAGVRAYPSVFPSGFIRLWRHSGEVSPLEHDGEPFVPLSGIPRVETVYCQDLSRRWIAYESDRYGFRNEERDDPVRPVDVALLGDSFVQGTCVADEHTLRARMTAGETTRSFGMNSTSVLTQSAIYREFIQNIGARRLVWFFFEGNDLADFEQEVRVPLLRSYLDDGYSQQLMERAEPLGHVVSAYIDDAIESQDVSSLTHDVRRPLAARVGEFLSLRRARFQIVKSPLAAFVRDWAGIRYTPVSENSIRAADWDTIERLWRDVVATQRAHGGDTTFVYLPDAYRFMDTDTGAWQLIEARAVAAWRRLGTRFVSVAAELHERQEPLALYDGSHFNEEGYAEVARVVSACVRDEAACGTAP